MQDEPALDRLLARSPLFWLIDHQEAEELLTLLEPVEFTKGQVLFLQGGPADAMWVLGKGAEVSISAQFPEERRPRLLARVGEGGALGEMALIEERERGATAVVTEGGLGYRISASHFDSLRSVRSPVAYKFLRQLVRELCRKLRATSKRAVGPSQSRPERPPPHASVPATLEDLGRVAVLASLPRVVQLALCQKLRRVEVSAIQPLWAEGDEADAAYFVLEGTASIGRNGRTLLELGPGAILGLVSCIDEGKRANSCVTAGPGRFLALADADFDELFAAQNPFAFQIVDEVSRQLAQHLRATNVAVGRPQAAVGQGLWRSEFLPLELELDLA